MLKKEDSILTLGAYDLAFFGEDKLAEQLARVLLFVKLFIKVPQLDGPSLNSQHLASRLEILAKKEFLHFILRSSSLLSASSSRSTHVFLIIRRPSLCFIEFSIHPVLVLQQEEINRLSSVLRVLESEYQTIFVILKLMIQDKYLSSITQYKNKINLMNFNVLNLAAGVELEPLVLVDSKLVVHGEYEVVLLELSLLGCFLTG